MPSFGIAESIIAAFIAIIFWGIPIAAAIWVILALRRIQSGQEKIQNRLEEIGRAVQGSLSRQ